MSGRGQDTRERILDAAQTLVMTKGCSGAAVDGIITATGLTKGAFFHHFRSKGDLARQLAQHFADTDFAMIAEWDRQADALGDDPYQALVIFLKLFEDWLDALSEPFAGCLFAVYVYENTLFDEDITGFVRESLLRWQGYYEKKIAAVLATRKPAIPVTAQSLAESIVSILDGAFILTRAYGDPGLISRQSRQFRDYLKLLFEPATAPVG